MKFQEAVELTYVSMSVSREDGLTDGLSGKDKGTIQAYAYSSLPRNRGPRSPERCEIPYYR
jgi:hypothetical protein